MSSSRDSLPPRRLVWSRYVLLALAAVFAIGAMAQFFLAGLSVFETPLRWGNHVALGHMIGLLATLMWIPALLGRVGRRLLTATVVMVILMVLQYVFIESGVPVMQSLHPLNGAVLFALSIWIAWRAAAGVRDAPRLGNSSPAMS